MPSLNRITTDIVPLFILWHEMWFWLHEREQKPYNPLQDKNWWREQTIKHPPDMDLLF